MWSEDLSRMPARGGLSTCTRKDRVCELLAMVGYVLVGLPGSRLLDRLGIPNSADTILRRVKTRMRGPEAPPPVRVLGVDDWAWRKQQHYGTTLMDLERQRIIDLLPVRSPAGLPPGSKRIVFRPFGKVRSTLPKTIPFGPS